jgi:hypothetical protein
MILGDCIACMKIEYHFAYKSLRAIRGIADFIVLNFIQQSYL